jgi:CRP/FNR family transcriptional regulator, cyclic AMP receptor protein
VKRLAVFTGFNEEDMDLLRPLFKELSFQAGTVIFQQGEPAEFLYLVTTGIVDMSFKPYDGLPMTISHVGKGGLFGWSAVVGSEKYTSSAIAIEAVNVFRVRGSELREYCSAHPEAGKTILERLADGASSRWNDAHKQVQAILLQGLGT